MRSLSLDISLRIACLCSGMTISNRKREFSFSLTKDRPAIEERRFHELKTVHIFHYSRARMSGGKAILGRKYLSL